VRIWQPPRFTHWPAVVYAGESRNLAFQLPLKQPGGNGRFHWQGGVELPFELPANPDWDQISGLAPLPEGIGTHLADVDIRDEQHELAIRRVGIADPWPHAALVEGFPVDSDGRPVVLQIQRRDPDLERRWSLMRPELPRPDGRALCLGDPLTAMGRGVFDGLDADVTVAMDARYPHHAALVALAQIDTWPETLIWSPGNAGLFARVWNAEEIRLLEAITSRCELAGALPRLVLVLPPVPIDRALEAQARERRELLGRVAGTLGWRVVDVDAVAGPAEEANRVGESAYTRYAHGAAQEAVRRALADLL
jgi:hypothetical protein